MIRIQEEDFDVGAELAGLRGGRADVGAIASFVGLMRDVNEGETVSRMLLEHYPGMTERALEQIVVEATSRWSLAEVLVVHRVGELAPGDQIVLVAVASRHRGAAFEACEFVMDYLKTRAPLWKKELKADGSGRWVSSRDSDARAAGRWRPAEG